MSPRRRAERDHKAEVEQTKLLFKMHQRHRRPLTRLVMTRIRGAINARDPNDIRAVY